MLSPLTFRLFWLNTQAHLLLPQTPSPVSPFICNSSTRNARRLQACLFHVYIPLKVNLIGVDMDHPQCYYQVTTYAHNQIYVP